MPPRRLTPELRGTMKELYTRISSTLALVAVLVLVVPQLRAQTLAWESLPNAQVSDGAQVPDLHSLGDTLYLVSRRAASGGNHLVVKRITNDSVYPNFSPMLDDKLIVSSAETRSDISPQGEIFMTHSFGQIARFRVGGATQVFPTPTVDDGMASRIQDIAVLNSTVGAEDLYVAFEGFSRFQFRIRRYTNGAWRDLTLPVRPAETRLQQLELEKLPDGTLRILLVQATKGYVLRVDGDEVTRVGDVIDVATFGGADFEAFADGTCLLKDPRTSTLYRLPAGADTWQTIDGAPAAGQVRIAAVPGGSVVAVGDGFRAQFGLFDGNSWTYGTFSFIESGSAQARYHKGYVYFTHRGQGTGNFLLRLRVGDASGLVERRPADAFAVRLSPNPVTGTIARLEVAAAERIERVSLVDVVGRTTGLVFAKAGEDALELTLPDLSPGVYWVLACDGQGACGRTALVR